MSKKKKAIYSLLGSLVLGSFVVNTLTSCNGGEVSTELKVVVTGAKNGKVGETVQLSALVVGDSSNSVTWSSNDVSIATVSESGLVTLNGEGTVSITATSTKDTTKKSSPVYITVFGETEVSKKLEIVSLPVIKKYKKGSNLNLSGLLVNSFTYYNGVKDANSCKTFDNLNGLSFSTADGTKLDKKGDLTITITASGYEATSFTVNVNDKLVENKLFITKNPSKSQYILKSGEKTAFDSTGLKVEKYTYTDGKFTSKKALKTGEYSLSMANGTEFTSEGSYNVEVTADDSESATFSVAVFTENTSVYDLVKNLQTAKNFQVEIMNSVGTVNDSYGFHYLRTYTENYYDEISYQNINNTSTNEIEFDTTHTKSHIGYTTYKDGDKYGIMQYKENGIGEIEGSTIISENKKSWWDKGSTLANMFTKFTLSNLPTYTLNNKFLITNIEQEVGDDEDGTKTIAKYPLIKDFLGYCGWSSSLITVMSRFTVSLTDDYKLSMKAYFGQYGITEMKVNAVGNAKNNDVEEAIKSGLLKPSTKIDTHVNDLKDLLSGNNYTRYTYSSTDGITSDALYYYTDTYYYNVSKKTGYFAKDGAIYNFKGIKDKATKQFNFEAGEKVEGATNLVEYVNSINASPATGYASLGMKDILGVDGGTNRLTTFAKFDNFSYGTTVCYQSFDESALAELESYYTAKEVSPDALSIPDGRLWMLAHYSDSTLAKETVQSLEIWDIAFTGSGGSGFVLALGSFGTTSVDWIENGINAFVAK